MKVSELGKFKPLLKGYNVKASEVNKLEETKIGNYIVWLVEFDIGSKRLWVNNTVNDNIFELFEYELANLINVISWGKTKLKGD